MAGTQASSDQWRLKPVYQPIVDLVTNETVGFEALARSDRWPDPLAMFTHAVADGSTSALDWACRLAAVNGAPRQEARHDRRNLLMVNVEPAAIDHPHHQWVAALSDIACDRGWRLGIEITERDLGRDRAGLIKFRHVLDRCGVLLAIDDVGADPASLAMMPLLQPDIVKLDMSLIQGATTMEQARIFAAVNAEATSTGLLVVAEGIETADHLEKAISMGAHMGQGYLLGRPGPLTETASASTAPPRRWVGVVPVDDHRVGATPWDLVTDQLPVRTARKPLLAAMSAHIEHQSLTMDPTTVLLGAFQHDRYVTAATRQRWSSLSRHNHLTAALGRHVDAHPAPGVVGGDLADRDPLVE